MKKRLISIILSAVLCIMTAVPAYAATTAYTYIESVSFSLLYADFQAGSLSNESDVTVQINDANPLYSLDTVAMSVPSNGWSAGDVPNLRVTFVVKNEDTTKFHYSASRPSGVSVGGGEVHYGEVKASSRKVYYEVHLNEVQDNDDEKWEDERDWNTSDDSSSSNGPGTGAKGAWLQDPNTKRYWWINANGSRPVNQWLKIGGLWFYFDASGYRVENKWVQTKNAWYYLGPDGAMYTNRRTPDNYWVNQNGAWDGKPAGSTV